MLQKKSNFGKLLVADRINALNGAIFIDRGNISLAIMVALAPVIFGF